MRWGSNSTWSICCWYIRLYNTSQQIVPIVLYNIASLTSTVKVMWALEIHCWPHLSTCRVEIFLSAKLWVQKWVTWALPHPFGGHLSSLWKTLHSLRVYKIWQPFLRQGWSLQNLQVYLLTPMDCATLLHVKATIVHGPPSIITRQRASVDSKLLCRPRNVSYYHIFQR